MFSLKSIVYKGTEVVSFQEKDQPSISEGWALIETSHVGICGSDLNIFAGAHPRAEAPLILGHEFSGTLIEGHPTLNVGTRVTVNPLLTCGRCIPCTTGQSHVCENLKLIGIDCDGGMGEYVKVPINSIVELPEGMPMASGALIEPAAVAVHAARQGNYLPGDNVVIFGAGTIGLCVAFTLRSYGATNITIFEPNELRLKKAEELGFATANPNNNNIKEIVLGQTNGVGADFVFD